ncbi:hypothetical protein Rhopal_002208-T1 [Rhodotorula paludigena]|uniref:Nucleic acid-binding protein n=1 Tax=Rhodotorula paludigena TaxID=86838 RepID=A0AAV5GFC4_9BASI|nr:hypothetical protein Rhopal_002208-T1 [Rhodotorula paludigena]
MPALVLPPTSTPAGRAAALVNDVYGQYVPDLAVSHGDQLSLDSPAGKATSLADVAAHLFEAAGKTNDALGTTDEQRLEAKRWLEQVEQGAWDQPEQLKAVDEQLTTKTYVAGESLTAGDLGVFAAVHPYIAHASHSALLSHPALTRHFDHVQHLPLVASVLARSAAPYLAPAVVPIDVDNVPVVEIKPDVKAKKPKAAPAAGEAAAAPAPKADKKQQKKEVEGKEAAPAAAAAAEGKKAKGEKKEKAPKEKKPAPPAPVAEAPAPWMIDLRVGKIVEVMQHPDADSLYVEKIDIGEAEPRTVVSGLVKYKTLDEMRGIKSFAMVLCATSPDGKDSGVEFVDPPAGSQPGDRVYFTSFADRQPLELLNPKKKIFEAVQPGFTTLENREAAWVNPEGGEVHRIVTDRGACAAPNFVGASLS